jgi:hypothetical protein
MPATLRVLAVALLLLPASGFAAEVDFFSPQGEVKGVRQVAARFSTSWSPSAIRARLNCSTSIAPRRARRWADQKNWVFD